MRFKMTSKNPFRNFARNLRRITIADITAEEKDTLYHDLWCEISPKLSETERYLNSSPAYSSRALRGGRPGSRGRFEDTSSAIARWMDQGRPGCRGRRHHAKEEADGGEGRRSRTGHASAGTEGRRDER